VRLIEARAELSADSDRDKNDTKVGRRRRLREPVGPEPRLCPAIGFYRIAGGKYKLRILWALNKRPHRYGEIRTSLLKGSLGQPVTPRVLSRELKDLQRRGLIEQKQFNVVPPKVEYSLTSRGRTLVPILRAIVKWGMTRIHEEILADEIPPAIFDHS
jgi:DNA-binding HxlR family transcriptional regulator